METTITFISNEKLGVFFSVIEEALRESTKKTRAAKIKWIADTLKKMKLVPPLEQNFLMSVSIGCDSSGNYGLFVVHLEPADAHDEARLG